MRWPLPGIQPIRPPHDGLFGGIRRHDRHTGIDLYAPEGSPVVAMEAGTIVAVIDFTGPAVGTSWWLPTRAILVEGASGVILYGEVDTDLIVGLELAEGMELGQVERVLRNDKGRPTSMLHLEHYFHGARRSVEGWPLGLKDPPKGLRDPLPLVEEHFKASETGVSYFHPEEE